MGMMSSSYEQSLMMIQQADAHRLAAQKRGMIR